MSRVCHSSGKRTTTGGRICRRGLAKKYGGVGSRVIAHNKRKFKPNLQRVRAVINGKVTRVWMAVSEIKAGKLTRPPKRMWEKPADAPEAAAE